MSKENDSRRRDAARRRIKRVLVGAYCCGLIGPVTVEFMFWRLDLASA